MALDKDLIDKLLGDYQKPEDLIGEKGLLKQLTKALVERALNAELTHHLGYEKHDPEGRGSGNSRNGIGKKTLTGDFGEIVYNLIKIGKMSKSDNDRREDFDDVYDFERAFVKEYEFKQEEEACRR